MPDAALSSAAERQRRHRARRKQGRFVVLTVFRPAGST